MRDYIYFILFVLCLIGHLYERISFERVGKQKEEERYILLYRRHSNMLIIILLALGIDYGVNIANRLFS